MRVGVGAVGLAFVLAIVLGATGVLAPKNQRVALGASTTLTIISGAVSVRHGTGEFASADDGTVLGPGDTVRTGADARAVLTYFEGSTVEIEPSSELTIDTAHGNPDGSTVIVMKQDLGTTWHVVTHLVQGGSKYEVHTTSSTASVRGTAFQVGVAEDLATTVTTTEGRVATSDANATTTVDVTPGLTTTTKKGEAPEPPKPAPEPERKVTVTVADPNALVLDSFGRANGVKDGKVIVQTPGAQVKVVDGKLVITMPNVPDGTLSTHFASTSTPDREIEVSTKVEEKGKAAVEVKDTVKTTASAPAVSGLDLKKSTTGESPTIEVKTGEELKKLEQLAPKIGAVPPTPTEAPKKADDGDKSDKSKDDQATGSKGTTTTGGNTTTTSGNTNSTSGKGATSNPTGGSSDSSKDAPQVPTSGFDPGLRIPPLPVAPKADDVKKAVDEIKKGEDAKKAGEDAQKAGDDALKKSDDARKAAEDAARAEEAKRAADDAAKVAADDAARKADEARRAIEDSKKADDARRALDDASKKAADARKASDDARQAAENAKKADDAKRAADETKRAADELKRIADDAARRAVEKAAQDTAKAAEDARQAAEDAKKKYVPNVNDFVNNPLSNKTVPAPKPKKD